MEGCRMRERERERETWERGRTHWRESRFKHRVTHQIQQRAYRISCNEILDVILNRFSRKGILCSVLQRAADNEILWQLREIIKETDKCSDDLKGMWHLPNIHLLWDRFIAYDLGGHPGHRTSKGHLCALVAELFGGAKIRDLHRIVVSDQHAKREAGAQS